MRIIQDDIVFLFLNKNILRLNEMVLMMGYNIHFKGVIWKIIPKLSLLPLLILSTGLVCTDTQIIPHDLPVIIASGTTGNVGHYIQTFQKIYIKNFNEGGNEIYKLRASVQILSVYCILYPHDCISEINKYCLNQNFNTHEY